MAISKIILNGTTQMDTTQVTVDSSNLLTGFTALGRDGESLIGTAKELPAYFNHTTLTPSDNDRSFSLEVGTTVRFIIFGCSHDFTIAPSQTTLIGGMITIGANRVIYANGSRVSVLNTSNGSTYYTSTSTGQTWTYSDGVLTISTTSGWYMESGTRYDFFWI